MKLFCCPFAGAGAGVYRPWSMPPESAIDLRPVQLAGREEQFDLEPHESIADSAGHVLAQIRSIASPGEVIALFGHSSGAAVAFEVARQISTGSAEFTVAHLIISGAPDPVTPLDLGLRGLTDDEFVEAVEKIAGYAHPALAEPELREMLLPPLRADMLARQDYRVPAGTALPVAITAIRGDGDLLVSRESLAGWAQVTSEGFALVELAGQHMYFLPDPAALLELFDQLLGEHHRVPEWSR